MANLEHIHSNPIRPEIQNGKVEWVTSKTSRPIEKLPLIFWSSGEQWDEVNIWALERLRNRDVKPKTVNTQLEHLHKYANWLEETQIDWRHFPQRKAERVLILWRGFLVGLRDRGDLGASTTTARMNAVIQFYRYAASRNFISHGERMWKDNSILIKYHDVVGFKRTLQRITTDISIPNRARQGIRLEDGLLPIRSEDMATLLKFTAENSSTELHLMLLTAFYTGARLGTITTLRTNSLDQALPDPQNRGFWVIPIGPGTGISTKFDISGDLMVHESVMKSLKAYQTSTQRLVRAIKAPKENRSFLFLTRNGKSYTPNTVDGEMVKLRRKGLSSGLKFLTSFKFHQSRATFGTWLMSICLEVVSAKAAIEFVKRAMHHKNEATTFGYITFLEHTKAKVEMANDFSKAFFGLKNTLTSAEDVK
jgi:integrase